MSVQTVASRMLALDYLRGFFIVVILIDHLWRWPSLLVIFSGKGELWSTAAEGFVIISGLLVGYVRGYKNKSLPMKTVTEKLVRRALLLYIWFIVMSVVYTACIWYLPTIANMPWIEIQKGNWTELITALLTFQEAHVWVHFLYLYAIFLALAPIVVLMLRKGLGWLAAVISLVLFSVGVWNNIEWLQWQVLFYLPTIAGYHLSDIQRWWRHIGKEQRKLLLGMLWSVFATTLLASVHFCLVNPDSPAASALNPLFAREPMTFGHVVLAFIWFTSLVMIFEYSITYIARWLGWLFEPFGTRSLTAYILHGVSITLFALLIADGTSIWINTALGLACILITWGLLQIPLVQKVIPR